MGGWNGIDFGGNLDHKTGKKFQNSKPVVRSDPSLLPPVQGKIHVK